jgi:hypothetical protein
VHILLVKKQKSQLHFLRRLLPLLSKSLNGQGKQEQFFYQRNLFLKDRLREQQFERLFRHHVLWRILTYEFDLLHFFILNYAL